MATMTKADLVRALAHAERRATLLAQCLEQAGAYREGSWLVLDRPLSGALLVHIGPDGVPSGTTVDPEDFLARGRMWTDLARDRTADYLLPFVLALKEYDARKIPARVA